MIPTYPNVTLNTELLELERALLMLEKLNIWLFMDSLYVGIAAFQVGVKTSIKLHITLEYQEWKGKCQI